MKGINKFFVEIHKANKRFTLEAWDAWKTYTEETLKSEVEARYPDGFKDFLVERFDNEVIKAKTEK